MTLVTFCFLSVSSLRHTLLSESFSVEMEDVIQIDSVPTIDQILLAILFPYYDESLKTFCFCESCPQYFPSRSKYIFEFISDNSPPA